MDPITISAKFAAYTWFNETVSGKRDSQSEAKRFADENWEHFLAHADKGLGNLLIRLNQPRSARKQRKREEVA